MNDFFVNTFVFKIKKEIIYEEMRTNYHDCDISHISNSTYINIKTFFKVDTGGSKAYLQ